MQPNGTDLIDLIVMLMSLMIMMMRILTMTMMVVMMMTDLTDHDKMSRYIKLYVSKIDMTSRALTVREQMITKRRAVTTRRRMQKRMVWRE